MYANTSFYFVFLNLLFQNGPMASGLKPQEASDRLTMFQVIFLVSLTSYTTKTSMCFVSTFLFTYFSASLNPQIQHHVDSVSNGLSRKVAS